MSTACIAQCVVVDRWMGGQQCGRRNHQTQIDHISNRWELPIYCATTFNGKFISGDRRLEPYSDNALMQLAQRLTSTWKSLFGGRMVRTPAGQSDMHAPRRVASKLVTGQCPQIAGFMAYKQTKHDKCCYCYFKYEKYITNKKYCLLGRFLNIWNIWTKVWHVGWPTRQTRK